MAQQIKIQLRSIYGETKAYPLCDKAKTFADMLGTKTLTPSALQHIKRLGFEVLVTDAFGMDAGRLAA